MGRPSLRELPYVTRCPEATAARMQEVLGGNLQLFLVATTGPSAFVVKQGAEEESKAKYRVFIGSRHRCSCGGVENDTLCVHVLFVMLKVLAVPDTDPLSWQVALLDAELETVLAMRQRSAARRVKHAFLRRRKEEEPKPPRPDEVCPVCLDPLSRPPLTYCAPSCGNWIHVRCMIEYARHNKLGTVRCPLCRESWGAAETVLATLRRKLDTPGKTGSDVHLGITCSQCHRRPVTGDRFRCLTCPTLFDLCSACFARGAHSQHPFVQKARVGDAWRPAPRTRRRDDTLQFRDLTPEDYDRLLALDNDDDLTLGAYIARDVLAASHSCPLGDSCAACAQAEPDAFFPCGHRTHRECARAAVDDRTDFLCPVCCEHFAPGLVRKKRRVVEDPPPEAPAVTAIFERARQRRHAAALAAGERRGADHLDLLRVTAVQETRRDNARLARERAVAESVRRKRAHMDERTRRATERRIANLAPSDTRLVCESATLLRPSPEQKSCDDEVRTTSAPRRLQSTLSNALRRGSAGLARAATTTPSQPMPPTPPVFQEAMVSRFAVAATRLLVAPPLPEQQVPTAS